MSSVDCSKRKKNRSSLVVPTLKKKTRKILCRPSSVDEKKRFLQFLHSINNQKLIISHMFTSPSSVLIKQSCRAAIRRHRSRGEGASARGSPAAAAVESLRCGYVVVSTLLAASRKKKNKKFPPRFFQPPSPPVGRAVTFSSVWIPSPAAASISRVSRLFSSSAAMCSSNASSRSPA